MSNDMRTPYLPGLAEDRCDGVLRNCDRFNTGDPTSDLCSAIKYFASETGTTVYNLSPGFNSAGDFALWLMSATKEKHEHHFPQKSQEKMKIRIVRRGIELFYVERYVDKENVWRYWLPKDGTFFHSPYEAIASAKIERDHEIAQKCERLGCDEHLEVEI